MSIHAIVARHARWLAAAACTLLLYSACDWIKRPTLNTDGTVTYSIGHNVAPVEDLANAVTDQLKRAVQQEASSTQRGIPPVPLSRLAADSHDGVLREPVGSNETREAGTRTAEIDALRAMETELNGIATVVRAGHAGLLTSRPVTVVQPMLHRLEIATGDYVRAVDAQPERYAGEHAEKLRWLDPINAMRDQMTASFAAADRTR